MNVVEVENLTKKFGDFTAVDNISFSIKKGEIFGLLGPNGAGKTTTIRMLSGVLRPTSGKIYISGIDMNKDPINAKRRIGWMSSESIIDDDLTAMENIEVQAKLHNNDNFKNFAIELLKDFDLYEFKDKLVSSFSTGMKKKLEIVMALVNNPDIIFMDEPTIGLDVNTRAVMWDIIKKANKERKVTILLTTHYMEEADNLCDRVAIIDHGKIIASGTPSELKKKYGQTTIEVVVKKNVRLSRDFKYVERGNTYIFYPLDVSKDISKIIKTIGVNNIVSLNVNNPSLDNVFLRLTGRRISEERMSSREYQRFVRGVRG